MAKRVVVDTGPIVAILCREDAQHLACVAALQQIHDVLITCWPVVTEVVHLLDDRVDRVRNLLAMLSSGAIHCVELPPDAVNWLDDFYARFAEHSPDLADAALMCLADQHRVETVFSLDRRDFAIYRTADNRALNVVPSDSMAT